MAQHCGVYQERLWTQFRNKAAAVDFLYPKLLSERNVLRRLEMSSSEDRVFMQHVAGEGGCLDEEEVISVLFRGDKRAYRSAMARVGCVGLVFREEEGNGDAWIHIPPPFLKYIEIPTPLQGRLGHRLMDTSIGLLRAFATEWLGLRLEASRREYIVRRIRHELLDPNKLARHLSRLEDQQREIFDFVIECGGRTSMGAIFRRFGDCDPVRRGMERLLWRNPLICCSDYNRPALSREVVIPTDVYHIAQSTLEKRTRSPRQLLHELLRAEVAEPKISKNNGAHILRDIAVFLGSVLRVRPRVLKKGGMGRNDLKKMFPFFVTERNSLYAEFILLFCEQTGLVVETERIWRVGPKAREWLKTRDQSLRNLFEFWLHTSYWSEGNADRNLRYSSQNHPKGDIEEKRTAVLETLSACTPGRWIEYDRFCQLLMKRKEFLDAFYGPRSGHSYRPGTLLSGAELIRRIVSESLYWIGVLEIGNPDAFQRETPPEGGNPDEVGAVKISELGHFLLGEDPTPFPERGVEKRFMVQPNMEIVVPPNLEETFYLDLCRFADIESVDVMTTFSLSMDSLRAGLDGGLGADEALRFLEEHAATGVPENVRHLIDACSAKHGEITLGSAPAYLATSDKALLDELKAQEVFRAYFKEALTEAAVFLDAEMDLNRLVKALRNRGYMPKVKGEVLTKPSSRRRNVALTARQLASALGALEALRTVVQEYDLKASLRFLTPVIDVLRHAGRDLPPEWVRDVEEEYVKGLRDALEDGSVGNPSSSASGLASKPGLQARPPSPEGGLPARGEAESGAVLSDSPDSAVMGYEGTNPALDRAEIGDLIGYAVANHLCVEIEYLGRGQDGKVSRRVVEPRSSNGFLLYAFCRLRGDDRVFKMDRVQYARLTGEQFGA